MKTIHSPEGVSLLMENLWLRHKAGIKQHPANVYLVELPPPTEEELAQARLKTKKKSRSEEETDDNEDNYGVWI